MKKQLNIHFQLLPYYLIYTLLVIFVLDNSFFWDKDILISKQAYWFFENSFNINLPLTHDNGFFPALSILLALLWKIFGIHLWVGHLLMLPFALWIIYEYRRFLKWFSDNKIFINLTLILLLIDTTLISQVVVVSTDLLLVLFFFVSLNALLYQKRRILYFSLVALSLTHLRGIMTCGIIFLFDYYLQFSNSGKKHYIKNFLYIFPYYMPFIIIHTIYYVYHFKTTGWFFSHEESPWAGCYEKVDLKGFIFNIGILGWRLVDFGRLFYWFIIGFFLFKYAKGRFIPDSHIIRLILLILLCSVVYFPTMLIYKILSDHRYIIPIYNLLTILTGYILFVKTGYTRWVRMTYIFLLIGLISGNFWIYPDKIAKGWSATAAHMPFYPLREKMINYLDEKNIPFSEVGSEIPNTTPLKYIFLNGDERFFPMKDLENQKYIFYSNVFNMFTEEEIDELKNNWILEKEYRCVQVKVQLYRKPYQ